MSDYSMRWTFLAACLLVQAVLLLNLGITINLESARELVEVLAQIMLFGVTFSVLSRRWGRLPAVAADVCFTFAQFIALLAILTPFSFLAATTNFPLLDGELSRLDALFGFEWDAVAAWVAERPTMEQALHKAYFALNAETLALLFLGSIARPGERNSEAIWLFLTAAVITVAIFAFTPALGKVGHLGTFQIETLTQIRAGHWTVLDHKALGGIVNFPSFHTTLAILWTYAVRRHLWALALAVPLNAAMILGVLPIGGHYLVDVFGGAAVAAVSILVVRALRRRTATSPAVATGPSLVPSASPAAAG